jgi:hypothetical protein
MSCGASFAGKTTSISGECVYCGANIVEELDMDKGLIPNAVIPFIITKEEASKKFATWIKRRSFVPNVFIKQANTFSLESVYVPVFEYDLVCSTKYKGRLRKTERDSEGDTRTVYKNVSGTINSENVGISIECSNYITQAAFDHVKPFWMDKVYGFDKRYLMGYTVEHPNTEVMVGRDKAKEINSKNIDQRIVDYYHYDGYDYINKDITYERINFRYTLYPIYRIKTEYKNQPVYVYMNGQTGKQGGKLPVSIVKILLFILGLMIPFGIFVMILITLGLV